MGSIKESYQEILKNGPQSTLQWVVFVPMWLLSVLYGIVVRLRVAAYSLGLKRFYRARVPVISIGNLSVGGTGKTPMVDFIVKRLVSKGLTTAIVSRGYGGDYKEDYALVSAGDGRIRMSPVQCGDEPWLLARRNPRVRVYVARQRSLGVRAAERDQVEAVVLDDGFQHLAVRRDLNIVLLDERTPFGNGCMLPAGPLREPISALSRADIAILTHAGEQPLHALPHVVAPLACHHRLADRLTSLDGAEAGWDEFIGKRCLAFAGIATPNDFFASLRDKGLDIKTGISFSDHQKYVPEILERLRTACRDHDCMITTEKDAVKLADAIFPLPCYQAAIDISFTDGALLEKRLNDLFDESL